MSVRAFSHSYAFYYACYRSQVASSAIGTVPTQIGQLGQLSALTKLYCDLESQSECVLNKPVRRKLNFELTDFISFKRDVLGFNFGFQSELGLHFMLILMFVDILS